jgi:hypothetical protein
MGSMLGFTEEDRAKISASRQRQGWRDISLASDVTLQGGGGAGGGGKQSLTDSWVDFLQQQIEADAAGRGADSAGTGASSYSPGAGACSSLSSGPSQQQPALL